MGKIASVSILFLILMVSCIERPTRKRIVFRPLADKVMVVDTGHTDTLIDSSLSATLDSGFIDSVKVSSQKIDVDVVKLKGKVVGDVMYYLVAASFQQPDNAMKYKKHLTDQGFLSHVILDETAPTTAAYKVSFAAFDNRDDAKNELTKQLADTVFKQAWILSVQKF